jgi:hypothetical protein
VRALRVKQSRSSPGAPGLSWQDRQLEQNTDQAMSQNVRLSATISAARSLAGTRGQASSGTVDRAGSPGRRGWGRRQMKPLMERQRQRRATMGHCRRIATYGDLVVVREAVYTSVQMLEMHPKTAIFRHFSGPTARLAAGDVRSATHCSIMRSDTTCARPGPRRTAWRGSTESAISKFADCSLSQH